MRISDWSSDVCSSDLDRYIHIGAPMTERAPGRTEENTARIDQHGQGDGGRDPVEQVAHIRAGARPDRDRQEHDIAGSEAGHRHCRSEEHTSELQSLMRISYAVFCLKKKTTYTHISTN